MKTNPDIRNIISLVFVVGVFAYVLVLILKPAPAENKELIQFFGGALTMGLSTIIQGIYNSQRVRDQRS